MKTQTKDNKVNYVYKIRNKEGLWSSGGCPPKFKKRGKTWSGLGDLNRHLAMIGSGLMNKYQSDSIKRHYIGCEIVPFKLLEENSISVLYHEEGRISNEKSKGSCNK